MELKNLKPKRSLIFASGVVISIIFILLAYLLNSSLERQVPLSLQNAIFGPLILLFLGLSSGYNIAMSLKGDGKVHYFYFGIFAPILLIAFVGSLTQIVSINDSLSPILMVLGLVFPILILHSGLIEESEKIYHLVQMFSKFVPTVILGTFAIGDYAFPALKIAFQFDIGSTPSFIIAFLISIGIIWLSNQKEE